MKKENYLKLQAQRLTTGQINRRRFIMSALATGVTVLGAEKGIELVNKLKGVECLAVDFENGIVVSKGLEEIIEIE